jgi:hypothetical protein
MVPLNHLLTFIWYHNTSDNSSQVCENNSRITEITQWFIHKTKDKSMNRKHFLLLNQRNLAVGMSLRKTVHRFMAVSRAWWRFKQFLAFLQIIKKSANNFVYASLFNWVSIAVRYIPRNEIAGLKGIYIKNIDWCN